MFIHVDTYMLFYIYTNKLSFNIISSARENNLAWKSYLHDFGIFSD